MKYAVEPGSEPKLEPNLEQDLTLEYPWEPGTGTKQISSEAKDIKKIIKKPLIQQFL